MKLFWFFIFNDHHQRLQKYTIISSSRESDVQERLYRRFNNAINKVPRYFQWERGGLTPTG